MAKKLPFPKIDQIGIVVKDLDKAVKYYESLGFGSFLFHRTNYQSRELWGKPVPPDVVLAKRASSKVGPIQIELTQPVAEGTPWMEFLKTKGEGIDHLGFFVDDFDMEEAKLLKKGLTIIYKSTSKYPDGSRGGAAYFDTGEVGGIAFELVRRAPI
ncbi:VOC family protein [Chloroflexota bacterium]